jgi:hypothetical protein
MICPETGNETRCTERCAECAKEMYRDLKGMTGSAEIVTKEAIINDLGARAFEMLRDHHYIEHCRVDESGRHWYAI